MADPKGFLHNCHLIARDGEVMFKVHPDGTIVPTLDGYLILPKERLQDVAASARVAADESTPAV